MASTMHPLKNDHDEHLTNLSLGVAGQADCAKGSASSGAQSAEDVGAFVGRKAEDATTVVGGGLKSLGNTIRAHTPHNGIVGEAASAVANTLESAGRYLQEEGLKGMAEEVTNLIRRKPVSALLVAFGAGFLIARATTTRR